MKQKFNRGITTKLLLVNAVIFATIGAIIFVVHASFDRIEESFTNIIDRDVSQVINNAQLGRDLNRVFMDANSLIQRMFNDDEVQGSDEAGKLIKTIESMVEHVPDKRLQASLHEFLQQLRSVFEQVAAIQSLSKKPQEIERSLTSNLAMFGQLTSEKQVTLSLEGKDPSFLIQMRSQIPEFRETLLQIAIRLGSMKQDYFIVKQVGTPQQEQDLKKKYSTLFLLLKALNLRLQALNVSDRELSEYKQKCIDGAQNYEETVILLQKNLLQFQTQLSEVRHLQENVLSAMREIDDHIAQATGKIREHVASIIGRSRRIIVSLSFIVVIVLVSGWFVTRWMTRPLVNLSLSATQLADGDIDCDVQDITAHDEIGLLSRSFKKLMIYFKEMASTATEISYGNLDLEIQPRSKKDVFGNQFQQMINYLKSIGEVAEHVSHGDLRSQVKLQSQHDQLGRAFIHMQKGLIGLISGIRSAADYLSSISTQMLGTSIKNSEALGQIGNAAEVTSSAMQEVSASTEEVRINIEHLSSSVEETSASISQMISSIKHVAENSRKLFAFAEDTSTTVGTIVSSIEKVADQAEHSKTLAETTAQDAISGQKSVKQMINRMSVISDVTEKLSTIILRLENRSKEIGTMLDVIREVADQTSLLSLNASIIAAQAGVHGRGFAVVADEIKELATRVGTSTKEIAEVVKAVQRDSSDAVDAIAQGQHEVYNGVQVAHEAEAALNKIDQSADNSSKVAAEIAVLVRQQTTATTHIAESIRDVTNMISEITQATEEQEKNSSQLFSIVENMQTSAAQVLQATQEQQQSTFHVTELMVDVTTLVGQSTPTVKQLAQLANALASQAEILKKHVEQFIIPSDPALVIH